MSIKVVEDMKVLGSWVCFDGTNQNDENMRKLNLVAQQVGPGAFAAMFDALTEGSRESGRVVAIQA